MNIEFKISRKSVNYAKALDFLEKRVSNFISTEIEWLPLNSVKVSSEQQDKIIEFFETLEDDDDVQNIFSNMEIKAN